MPEYFHECQNPECKNEWWDTYSIKQDPPKICPKCGKETAKRMISGATPGKVELSGNEWAAKMKSDAKQIQKDAAKNEVLYSNLIGPDKYQGLQQQIDRQKKEKR